MEWIILGAILGTGSSIRRCIECLLLADVDKEIGMELDEETGELFLVWSPEKTTGARARLAAQVPPQEVARLKAELEQINSDDEEDVHLLAAALIHGKAGQSGC